MHVHTGNWLKFFFFFFLMQKCCVSEWSLRLSIFIIKMYNLSVFMDIFFIFWSQTMNENEIMTAAHEHHLLTKVNSHSCAAAPSFLSSCLSFCISLSHLCLTLRRLVVRSRGCMVKVTLEHIITNKRPKKKKKKKSKRMLHPPLSSIPRSLHHPSRRILSLIHRWIMNLIFFLKMSDTFLWSLNSYSS